jgi:hypothetical protein
MTGKSLAVIIVLCTLSGCVSGFLFALAFFQAFKP